MYGIYHNKDLDGFTSGAIINKKYPKAEMLGFDYNEEFPKLKKGEAVIMSDVSQPMKDMLEIAKNSDFDFTWIDHHKSAIDAYKEFFIGSKEDFIKAILDIKISACEGTWKHLFPNEEMPEAVLLLGEYDTFRNKDKKRWEEIILPFQFGMRSICNSIETFPIELFKSNNKVKEIIEIGKAILKYQTLANETMADKRAFTAEFQKLNVICLNGGIYNSDTFKSVYDPKKHDAMLTFQFDGVAWQCSIYSNKKEVDCSVIAKSLGGGGHAGASGFTTDDIFKLIKVKK